MKRVVIFFCHCHCYTLLLPAQLPLPRYGVLLSIFSFLFSLLRRTWIKFLVWETHTTVVGKRIFMSFFHAMPPYYKNSPVYTAHHITSISPARHAFLSKTISLSTGFSSFPPSFLFFLPFLCIIIISVVICVDSSTYVWVANNNVYVCVSISYYYV